MSFTPTAGPVAVLKIESGSLMAQTIFPGINWKIDHDPKLKDVSNFETGRTEAQTLPDSTLTFTLVYDNTTNPFLAANGGLKAGAPLTANCYTASAAFFVFTGLVSKVGAGVAGLEDVVMCDIEARESGGALVYPAS